MEQKNRRHATRSLLLEAAVRLIERESLPGFTLEAVALEAGVSKGGLFYHFSGKQALVRGMLEVAMETFEKRVEELLCEQPERKYAEAFVRAVLEAATSVQHLRTTTALCAAITEYPELLVPYAQRSQQWQTRLEQENTSAAHATVARLAADGLFYAKLFGSEEVFSSQRAEVLRLILELAGADSG